jgi:AGZA family xanthine/uracil permease-like MFS transporter
MHAFLDRWFRLTERKTSPRAEIVGGVTTFVTMAYIVVLNPAILSAAGIPVGPSTVATVLTAVFGTLLMGLYANRPIGVAPYMGENAFIAFGLAALGVGWELRLGSVFVAGAFFLAITLLGVRQWLADSISPSMKHSFAIGIGLFLAFLGLYQTGIVTSFVEGAPVAILGDEFARKPDVPVKLGNLTDPRVQLAIGGFVLTSALVCLRVTGAMLIGIAVTATIGISLGHGSAPQGIVALPFVGKYSLNELAFHADIAGVFRLTFLPVLMTLVIMSFLDTLGTLVGVGAAGDMLDEKGNLPDMRRPMIVDAASCMFAAMVGSSTSGAYIESAAGVKEGARTGLAAVVTALLFAATLFFIPLVQPIAELSYAYGPALILVGVMMLSSVQKIDFADMTELVPACVTIFMIAFTYNIGNGLTAGLVLYPVLKLLTGRARELHSGSIVLGLACAAYYVWGLPH